MEDENTGGMGREDFERAFEEASKKIGRVNIAVFGKTGVGKSTLINGVFGDSVAETGIGEPVTKGSRLHIRSDGRLGIVDNEGLEIGRDSKTIIKDLKKHVEAQRHQDLSDQLHLAWYCVAAPARRFERRGVEEQFVRSLADLEIPVVVVLTQVPLTSEGVHEDAKALASHIESLELPIFEDRVILTAAKRDRALHLEPHGLDDLVECSFRAAPEGVRTAFVAAQQLSKKLKERETDLTITAAIAAATATGATPIPFAQAIPLGLIQTGMMMKIANVYGLGLDTATGAALAAVSTATQMGPNIAGNLAKCIPGVGSVAGGAINAAVAGSLTFGMGMGWREVCIKISEGEIDESVIRDRQQLVELFMREFKRFAGSWRGWFGDGPEGALT